MHIFLDYTAEVATKRRAFGSVVKVLREAGVPCSLPFPARLRVKHKDSILFFDSPGEARKFADCIINVN